MLALAISTGVKVVMSNHTYTVGDQSFLQTIGGAIGLELTGAFVKSFHVEMGQALLGKN